MTCCFSGPFNIVSPALPDCVSCHIERNGRRLHYLTATCENGNKPWRLFILLHGVGSSSMLWKDYLGFLKYRYFPMKDNFNIRIVVPDMFGHGQSTKTSTKPDYNFSEMVKDISMLFDEEMTSCDRAVFIGHSYGCSILSALADQRQGQIFALFFISPPPPIPLQPDDKLLYAPACCFACLFPCMKVSFRRNAYSKQFCFSGSMDSITLNVKPRVLQYTMLGQVWPEGDHELFARLSNIPSVIVHGNDDRLVPLRNAELTGKVMGAKFYNVKSCGHFVLLEAFDAVSNVLLTFLSSFS